MNRRELLATYSAMMTVGVAGCSAPQRGQPTDDERLPTEEIRDWPTFLYDRTNRRCFSSEHIAVEQPSIRWSYETGDAVWASPVIVDGTLYVGSYDGRLYAISIETGDVLWQYQTGDRIDGSPAVANGTVFFGSFDRNIYALDAETGEERWIYGTRGINRSSPAVADGTIYIGAFARAEEASAYYDVQWPARGSVYAIDTESGDLRWRHETDDGVMGTPAIREETVYVGSSDATLYAIDASTGEPRWRYETGGPIMSSPAYVDGRIIFGNVAGEVYALDAGNGDLLWSFDANRRSRRGVDLPVVITGSPTVCDGTVYVGSMVPGDEIYGELYAISATHGGAEWTAAPFAQAVGSSPVVVNDIVYVGAHTFDPSLDVDAGIYAIDEDGTVRWSYTIDGEDHRGFGSSPAIVGTTLYIGSTDGHIHAFELG